MIRLAQDDSSQSGMGIEDESNQRNNNVLIVSGCLPYVQMCDRKRCELVVSPEVPILGVISAN